MAGIKTCYREFEVTLSLDQGNEFLDKTLKLLEGTDNLEALLVLAEDKPEEFAESLQMIWLVTAAEINVRIGDDNYTGSYSDPIFLIELFKRSVVDIVLKGMAKVEYQPWVIERYYEWQPGPAKQNIAWLWVLAEALKKNPDAPVYKGEEDVVSINGGQNYTDFVHLLTHAITMMGYELEIPTVIKVPDRKH